MSEELKIYKIQTTLILEYEKIDEYELTQKIFLSNTKLITNDSDIDKAFGSMYQNVITKIENKTQDRKNRTQR